MTNWVVKNGILSFSGPTYASDGVVTAPSMTFLNDTTTGFFLGGVSTIRISVGGSDRFQFDPNGLYLGSVTALKWADATTIIGAGSFDITLARDAAAVLAQRNGTNAQTFRVYQTYTDASNNELGAFGWSGSNFSILTQANGTGTARSINIIPAGGPSGWQFAATTGHFLALTDNTYDIGASGATRPRTGYFGTSIVSPLIQATARVIFDGTTTSTGAGAVGITGSIHEITTTGTGDALTLANGAEGQRLSIIYVAEGAGTDTAVLTPTTFGSGSTITFSVVGQSAHLIFTNGKWYADSAPFGAVIA